jgi:probable phosphomutase (TIGR03848 family)
VTSFLLVRHALCDPVGRSIAGRAPGVHLNAKGRLQADELGRRLGDLAISAVYSSPLERALETAGPIAAQQGVPVVEAPGLTEIDFGSWTGKTLQELDQLPQWKDFNIHRSGTRAPEGEGMTDVLARALGEMNRIRAEHDTREALVTLVSHGDVLRALLAHFLGVSLDLFQRIEISPASVSVVTLENHGPRVLLLNSTGEWPSQLALRKRR